jgi:hypothetical protein
MKSYSDAIDIAEHLSFIPHWIIGTIGFVSFMLIENAPAFFDEGVLAVTIFGLFGGLVFSVISRLLMLLCPWPYAWLKSRINLALAS